MIKAFIDRIEHDRAVIVTSDEAALQFDLPVDLLPAPAAPGDHLAIHIERAPDQTAATLQTIQQLKSELLATNDSEQLDFKL